MSDIFQSHTFVFGLAATGSASYLCFEGWKIYQFNVFRKNGHDGNFRLFEGVITKVVPHNQARSAESCLDFIVDSVNKSVSKDDTERFIRKIVIDEGIKKQGIYYTPVTVGKVTIMQPHHYTYTDYKQIFSKTMWPEQFKIGNITISMTGIQNPTIVIPMNKCKMYPRNLGLADIFRGLGIDFSRTVGDKYRFSEGHIDYGQTTAVAGDYSYKSSITPRYIGSKTDLLRLIRRQRYSVNPLGIGLATATLVTSVYMLSI